MSGAGGVTLKRAKEPRLIPRTRRVCSAPSGDSERKRAAVCGWIGLPRNDVEVLGMTVMLNTLKINFLNDLMHHSKCGNFLEAENSQNRFLLHLTRSKR